MSVAIKIEGLSKKYYINRQNSTGSKYVALRDVLAENIKSIFTRSETSHQKKEEFWALKDISMSISHGDKIGIIGHNGAGKSTLLKILSKITPPTKGCIHVRGRVASLLEVGTGFHPELTGRENIFFNGAILGMNRKEIESKFDEIVSFAGVERFIDTPVKRYSSGMRLRLAFAVASSLESEILLIDEILAVGDEEFRKKCFGRMNEISSHEGRTILFVSHNLLAIRSLCSHAIWLENGQIKESGHPKTVSENYLNSKKQYSLDELNIIENNINLHFTCSHQESGEIKSRFGINETFMISSEFTTDLDKTVLNASIVLYTIDGIPVFNSYSQSIPLTRGRYRFSCKINKDILNAGIYNIRTLIVQDSNLRLIDCYDSCVVEIFEDTRESAWLGEQIGIVRPRLEWDFCAINPK